MEVFKSADGHHKLAFNGYIYRLKSNNSNSIEWVCYKGHKMTTRCHGHIVSNKQCTAVYPGVASYSEHSHWKDEDSVILMRYRNAIRLAVMKSDKSPAEILAAALPKLPWKLQRRLEDERKLRKWIYGADSTRSLNEPFHPKDINDNTEPVTSTNDIERIETSDKFEVLTSQRDKLKLAYEGHIYTIWRVTSKHIRWNCTKTDDGKRCKGALSTDREITGVMTSSLTEHIHPPDEIEIEVVKSRLELKKAAMNCSDPPSSLLNAYLRDLPEHVLEKTRNEETLKRAIRYYRRRSSKRITTEKEPKKPRTDQPSSSSDDVNVKLEFFESEDENQSQAGPSSSNPGTSYGYSSQQSTSGGNSSSLSLCDNTNDQSSSSSDRPFIEPEVVIKIKEEPLSDDEESILPTPISCPPPVSTSFKVGKKAVQQISMPHIAGVTTAPGVGTSTSFSFNTTHQQAASQTPMAAIAPTIQSPIKSSTLPADRSLPAIPIGNVATSTHRDSSSLATGVSSTETQQQQRDSLDTFGEYIAARLRVLDRTTQTIAQKMINDILFDAEMGRLKS